MSVKSVGVVEEARQLTDEHRVFKLVAAAGWRAVDTKEVKSLVPKGDGELDELEAVVVEVKVLLEGEAWQEAGFVDDGYAATTTPRWSRE